MIAFVFVMAPSGHVHACEREGSEYRCAYCQIGWLGSEPVSGSCCPVCDAEVRSICVPDSFPEKKRRRGQLALF